MQEKIIPVRKESDMDGMKCDCGTIRISYHQDERGLTVYFEDLSKHIPLLINSDTHIKCLPLSGTRNCITAHAPEEVGKIVAALGTADGAGTYHTEAHITGYLSGYGSGKFQFSATSVLFSTGNCRVKCPFDKNCRPDGSLEVSATPTDV